MMQPGERGSCPHCGEGYVGALNVVSKVHQTAGMTDERGVLPVALAPDQRDGNVLLQQVDGVLRCIVFGASDTLTYLRDSGVQLRRLHFANTDSCLPAADRQPPTRPTGATP